MINVHIPPHMPLSPHISIQLARAMALQRRNVNILITDLAPVLHGPGTTQGSTKIIIHKQILFEYLIEKWENSK